MHKVGDGWQAFFENRDQENCPVTRCELMGGEECEQVYGGQEITMADDGRYGVYASR